MVNNLMQLAGLAMVVAFSWWVWEPLPLLVGGVVLAVGAEARAARTARRAREAEGKTAAPGAVERLLRGLQAARAESR